MPTNPRADSEVVAALDRYKRLLIDAAMYTGLATSGVRHVHFGQLSDSGTPENPDPQLFVGTGPPTDPTGVLGWWRHSYARGMTEVDGPLDTFLNDSFIVYAYAEWDEQCRPELSRALGEVVNSAVHGELRNLRHDIIHNQGRASSKYSCRCRMLTLTPLSEGERIRFPGPEFPRLVRCLYDEVDRLYESLCLRNGLSGSLDD